ncbi:RsmF rRNA methyltransferase first C-terminal domain-containing protein [Erysipelotrichaceae bacterium RD49]|nr:RsmF rRNA methyltransferase first C-terminal domain-containing protein [Erysipelotrichaceae bacterium RD49]
MDPLFEKRMAGLLGDELEAYQQSLELPLYQGLRISARKQDLEITKKQLPFLEEPSKFAQNTWYIHGQYGLHPDHIQGLFYLQEPSAGSAVEVLNVRPGDTVLDLCAAPGSKSTQILDRLEDGFLLSNEIDPKRAQVLLSNMERMGAENFMVTNMDSKTLCSQLPQTFDKVLVDAPCSGEGMIKKHEVALDQWSYPNILLCAARQKDILKQAWQSLKPGGQLVYSTCTYAQEENEDNVAWLLETFDDARQLDVDVKWGRPGMPTQGMDASKVRRIFPMDGGEGHFVARFEKKASADLQEETRNGKPAKSAKQTKPAALPLEAASFLKEQLPEGFACYQVIKTKDGVQVYGMNHPFLTLKKGKVLRQGVQIGELIKNRFEPAHAFYLSKSVARKGRAKTETTLEQMNSFYHGEQLNMEAPKGFRALCYRGIPYGFGKSSQSRVTNKLPKGLRLNPGSKILDGLDLEVHKNDTNNSTPASR